MLANHQFLRPDSLPSPFSVSRSPQGGNETSNRRLNAISFLDVVGFSTLMAKNAARTNRA